MRGEQPNELAPGKRLVVDDEHLGARHAGLPVGAAALSGARRSRGAPGHLSRSASAEQAPC
jgi:hypothetical protein